MDNQVQAASPVIQSSGKGRKGTSGSSGLEVQEDSERYCFKGEDKMMNGLRHLFNLIIRILLRHAALNIACPPHFSQGIARLKSSSKRGQARCGRGCTDLSSRRPNPNELYSLAASRHMVNEKPVKHTTEWNFSCRNPCLQFP